MASAGGVHTEFTGSTAKLREAMDRGKKAAAKFAGGVKKSMSDVRSSNASAERAFGRTTDQTKRATNAIQGLSAGVSASAGALRLSGSQAASSLGEMANNVVSLSSGIGPLAAGLVAVTATVLAFKSAMDLANASSNKSIEFSRRLMVATDEQKDIYKQAASAAMEMEAAERGITVAELQRVKAIEDVRRQLKRAQDERDRLWSGGSSSTSDDWKAANFAAIELSARLENLERARTTINANESRKRAEIEEKAEADRLAIEARLREAAEKTEAARAEAAKVAAEKLKAIQDQRMADAARELAASRLSASQAAGREVNLIRARIASIGKSELDARLYILREQERMEIAALDGTGASKLAIQTKYIELRRLAEAEDAERRRLAAIAVAEREAQDVENARTAAAEAAAQRAKAAIDAAGAQRRDARLAAEQAARDGDFGGGIADGIKAARSGLENLRALGSRVGQNMADSLGGAFASFVTGAQSAKEAFKSFARSFVLDTIAMIAKAAILAGLQSIVTGGASAATGSAAFAQSAAGVAGISTNLAALGGGVPDFATGGSFMVGGRGGVDSQFVAFNASPNERVTVETPEQQRARGSVRVVVNNNGPPLRASASSQLGADGVREIVISTVVDDIARNGPMGKALEGHVRRLRGGRNT